MSAFFRNAIAASNPCQKHRTFCPIATPSVVCPRCLATVVLGQWRRHWNERCPGNEQQLRQPVRLKPRRPLMETVIAPMVRHSDKQPDSPILQQVTQFLWFSGDALDFNLDADIFNVSRIPKILLLLCILHVLGRLYTRATSGSI